MWKLRVHGWVWGKNAWHGGVYKWPGSSCLFTQISRAFFSRNNLTQTPVFQRIVKIVKTLNRQVRNEFLIREKCITRSFYKKLGFLAPGLKFAKKIGNLLRNFRPQILNQGKNFHRHSRVIQKLFKTPSQGNKITKIVSKHSHKVAKMPLNPPTKKCW